MSLVVDAELRASLIAQARGLLYGQPKRFGPGHKANRHCAGSINPRTGEMFPPRCLEVHVLGGVNPPTWTGDEIIFGPRSAGTMFAEWNIHGNYYERAWIQFQVGVGWSEGVDVTEAIER